MKIRSVELNNFRSFSDKKLSFTDKVGKVRQFTVLIGDNSAGKTTVLEAITKCFVPTMRTLSRTAVQNCDIKDSDINGVHINKDEFMAIKGTKEIISSHKSKFEALKSLLSKIVDNKSGIITLLLGEDVTENEENLVNNYIKEKYEGVDIDIRRGNQPIYSYIVGVE